MGEEETGPEPEVQLPEMAPGEQVIDDYASIRMTLRQHPVSFLRADLRDRGYLRAEDLWDIEQDGRASCAGLVLVRQRPGSAKGVIFATLEDETGVCNVVLWPKVFESFRRPFLQASLLGVTGWIQRDGLVLHLVADKVEDLSRNLAKLQQAGATRGLDNAMARADEVRRPIQEARNFH
jgi:error-prone DNA polymerase